MSRLGVVRLASAGAIVAALMMLALSLMAKAGLYEGAYAMMQEWHAFYSLSAGGVIAGMAEAAAITSVALAAFAWTYNKLEGTDQ